MHFDVVLTEGLPAANFLLNNPDVLPNVERLFVERGFHIENVPTIPIGFDFAGAIAEMDRLVKPKTVYVVADTSTKGRKLRLNTFQEALKTTQVGFEVVYLNDLPMGSLLEKVSNLPEKSAIFYLLLFKDAQGQPISPYRAVQLLAQQANAPIFTHWRTLMGSGVTGGYLLSGELVGEIVGEAAIAIVSGGPVPDAADAVFGYYYDWRQLKRWGISLDKLPQDVQLLHYEPTLIEEYKGHFISLLTFIVGLIGVAGWLVYSNRERKLAVDALEHERLGLSKDIQQRTEELIESEKKYRSIFEASRVGFALCKMDGSLIECNQAYLDIIGYSEQEALKLTYWDLTPRSFEAQEIEQLESIEKTGSYGPYEKHYIHKNGHNVYVLLNGTKLKGIDGNEYIWSIVQDISERKQLEQSKTDFISTVSHELRTPLTSIKGSLGLIVGGVSGRESGKSDQLLSIALGNADQLIALVDDILDLEKLQSGKMELNFEDIDLVQLVYDTVALNQGYSLKYGVEFHVEKLTQDVHVVADRVRITQVITNLLSNAAKFSPKGCMVHIFITTETEMAKITVRDHGPGVSPEFKTKLFERFSQEDASDRRKYGGTGLGLSICKTIVEKHNGEIGVVSEQNEGSTFYFTLPRLINT
ncbi:MAG: PAS domain-containing sensor histidine kinase [Magnetovibrio sp.]|nr:PAS domain-containing sensor histidine kinase [Magnetovibrio sp.]